MLYYKNIAKFPIKCDGVEVKPGEIHKTNHYINSRHMYRVAEPKPVKVEPKIEVIEEIKPKEIKKFSEDKLTVLSIPKPVRQTTRRRNTKSNSKNINKENKSEETK